MFILGDDSHANGKFPFVTIGLIAVNVAVFCAQILLGPDFSLRYSLIPKEISTFQDVLKKKPIQSPAPVALTNRSGRQVIPQSPGTIRVYDYVPPPFEGRFEAIGPARIALTLITYMFLHADWLHLLGNMWFLAVFGRNVEYALNSGRFLVFYLLCGVAAALAYTASAPASELHCIGASGAISGVMGAYVAVLPFNLVLVWLGPLGIWKLPAFAIVGAWFAFQYVAAVESLEKTDPLADRVAYWAHIGGFVAGIVLIWGLILFLNIKKRLRPV